ncbi:hypothetical protein DCO57_09305 [Labrenzia sp. 011]|nr:hypothetical protein DCO57_09305 [Labrenzia sp. 011]
MACSHGSFIDITCLMEFTGKQVVSLQVPDHPVSVRQDATGSGSPGQTYGYHDWSADRSSIEEKHRKVRLFGVNSGRGMAFGG